MNKGIKYDFVVAKPQKRGQKYRHVMLVEGADLEKCKRKVSYFFKNYQLVRYFNTKMAEDKCLPCSSPGFWNAIDQAVLKNRGILSEMVEELRHEGVNTLHDLEHIPQGYQSNMLHVITHLLDGFFGIDSHFFNLVEDSHWVSDELRARMRACPAGYWLVEVEADFEQAY